LSVARKPRADGQRNRERLVEAAKAAFAETGPGVSLEEIARRAGVGIGTLYRHFPTRDAVIQAVYRREVEQLAAAATRLLDSHAPGEALHEWLRLLVDYIATKKVVAQAISPAVGGVAALYPTSGVQITEAMAQLMARAVASGEIRGDVDSTDLLRGLVGFTYGADAPGWRESALRLLDIMMDGLKRSRGPL
jgi:AcrR family transcriptional regulator